MRDAERGTFSGHPLRLARFVSFLSVRFDTDASGAERWSDALIEAGALSVDVSDPLAGTPEEAARYGEPGEPGVGFWEVSRVEALFAGGVDIARVLARLARALGEPLPLHESRAVADRDWVRATQSQFGPIDLGAGFYVVPTWCEPPRDAAIVLSLDPGLAFGTGTHPTTRMCLRWIARHADTLAPSWQRTLDYGCGSGVLAIAAALHGARGVDAVDIDAAAVDATRANAAANGVTLHCGAPDLAKGAYALVLANILATPLRVLAPLLSAHVAAGGHLVLSGILERQADELALAYASWLELSVADREDGWILMCAQRRA